MKPRLALLTVTALVLSVVPTEAQDAAPTRSFELPLPVPERPFLLTQADRRFLPTEVAQLHIEHRGETDVIVEVYRVVDPTALLASTSPAEALALASGPLGAEMERLSIASGALPRRGNALVHVGTHAASLGRHARRGRIRREHVVYDSYEDEETDVETWGVDAGDWTNRNVSIGVLPAGVYIARVTEGAWASAALVSIGTMTLLVRRGDDHDEVRVVGPEGAPIAGVRVATQVGTRAITTGTTDASGRVELAASTEPSVRFVATRGDDVSWADVSHARMTACDPRVYLGVGRPVFRYGETMHVRGHVRGCDAAGNEGPLVNEEVVVFAGSSAVVVSSDAHGDFIAEGPAGSTIVAQVRGHDSVRDVAMDSRELPDHAVLVTPDRTAVPSGGHFTVHVGDDDGDWPVTGNVTLTFAEMTYSLPIGPGRPAIFSLTAPRTESVLDRLPMRAVLEASGRLVFASAEVWTGARAEVMELDVDRAIARTGESVILRASVRDLEGRAREGAPVTLELLPSDGNRPTSMTAVSSSTVTTSADGSAVGSLVVRGAGPWWARARAGLASAGVAVRNRPTPPPLSRRADVSLRLPSDSVAPGSALEVDVFGRGGGAAWVTLETGSVWASRLVELTSDRAHVSLPVPERARGLATVVVTQIHQGRARSASRAVEVRTSEPIALSVTTNARTSPVSSALHVTLAARDPHGAPRDAVVSVWMANAGYWDLGEERYPLPAEIFRLPGRPASGGDGDAPIAFGSEEGRRVDAHLTWNGAAMPDASFRHAWGYGGALVSFDAASSMSRIVSALARQAGLRDARFCEETARALGEVRFSVASLPWDLVALRIAERVELRVDVENDVLIYHCPGDLSGSGYGAGMGSRSASAPHIRAGSADMRQDERELLEGDLFFDGHIELGPDGVAEIDIPMPARPGRFRIEALAITGDGGGDRAHAIVHTTSAAVVRIELPDHLAVGDAADGTIVVSVPGAPGATAQVDLTLPPGIALEAPVASSLVLDDHGEARVPFRVAASTEGARSIEVAVAAGGASDRTRFPLHVRSPITEHPVAFRALVGQGATDVTISLPPRAEPSTLRLRVDGDTERAIESALSELAEPRWSWAPLRLDRLEALVALQRAASRVEDAHAHELERRVAGGIEELLALVSSDGGVSAFPGAPSDQWLTAALVVAAEGSRAESRVSAARTTLLRAAREGTVEPGAAPIVALAIAHEEPERSAQLLEGVLPHDIDGASFALRAAHVIENAELVARYDRLTRHRIDDELGALDGADTCRGPAWFACFARLGARGRLARAAEALVIGGRPGARERAAEVALAISRVSAAQGMFAWGHADADVIALVSTLEAHAQRPRFELLVGDRRTTITSDDLMITVPAGDAPVTLRLPADADRMACVRVDGAIMVRPEDLPSGDVDLERHLRVTPLGTSIELAITMPEAGAATLFVPIPAGLELGLAAGERAQLSGTGTRSFEWAPRDPRPDPSAPTLEVAPDGIYVDFADLPRGATRIELPLARVGTGHFGAAAAVVVTRAGGFGSAPAFAIDL